MASIAALMKNNENSRSKQKHDIIKITPRTMRSRTTPHILAVLELQTLRWRRCTVCPSACLKAQKRSKQISKATDAIFMSCGYSLVSSEPIQITKSCRIVRASVFSRRPFADSESAAGLVWCNHTFCCHWLILVAAFRTIP